MPEEVFGYKFLNLYLVIGARIGDGVQVSETLLVIGARRGVGVEGSGIIAVVKSQSPQS